MTALSATLNSLNFAHQLLVLQPIIERANVHMGASGPELHAEGYEGSVSAIDVVARIDAAAQERFGSALTLQERVAGIKIMEKMKALYLGTMGLTELPSEQERSFSEISNNFRAIPEAEFISLFGNRRVGEGIFEDYEHSDGYMSVHSGDGNPQSYILATKAAIFAALDMQNRRGCGRDARQQELNAK